ncbi:MAG: 50S ribosomal protein L1 [Candidatus Marinimicrobia bacterium]|nr:50S ribosomal protein L1 [Candidatus Neomarinimicrobiota bacterium]
MAKHGKKYLAVSRKLEPGRVFELDEALTFLKEHATAGFDETAEIAFRLGVDPRKSDQMVRGTVALPHGTGKAVRVAVFATGEAAEAAQAAGASAVGMDDLIEKVKGGWTDFDVAVATPEAMKEVRKLGKVLGPRGLMPNPKTGTVTDDTAAAVKQCLAGRVEFKLDRHGNIMAPFGKLSFELSQLADNAKAVIEAVRAAKPSAAKGIYIKRCTLTSTMGPGLTLNLREQAA